MSRPAATTVLDLARHYIGYHEGHDIYGRWNNLTRFGQEFGENGIAWCQIFIWCLMKETGGEQLVTKTASCPEEWAWFRGQKRARTGDHPQHGALIYFGANASEHVGIVESFDDRHVTYISGNTGDGTTPPGVGNSVQRKAIPRGDRRIWGYAYPDYAAAGPRPYRGQTRVVRIRKGQTLAGLAAAASVALNVVLGLNPDLASHPRTIPVGSRVTLPATAPARTPTAAPSTPAPATPSPCATKPAHHPTHRPTHRPTRTPAPGSTP